MKKLFNTFVFIFLMAMYPSVCSAQTFEEYVNEARKEFRSYARQANQDFEDFRKRANEEYSEYMRRAWALYKGEPAVPAPKDDDLPPVVCPDIDLDSIEDNEIPYIDVIPYDFDDTPLAPVPIKPIAQPSPKKLSVMFYGTETFVRFDPDKRFKMTDARESSAADMWKAMNTDDYSTLVADCFGVKCDIKLCDWAFQSYLDKVGEAIYGKSNEAVMLKAFILNQTGYKTRIGRDDNDKLHVLLSLTDDIFDHAYFNLDGTHYYLTDGSKNQTLHIFDQSFPNEKSLRMTLGSSASLSFRPSRQIVCQSKDYPQVRVVTSINKNLMDFFADYPKPFKRNDSYSIWSFYANTPISEKVRKEIYPVLSANIAGKSQADAANILINFVQTAFEYMTDEDQWGYERSFFPEETLYYPYSDCEDRAILFTRLVRDLMGLKAVLVFYPGHLASAVRFTEPVRGDFLNIAGDKYLICDPTYIHAPIGLTMPQMDNSKATVVFLD